MKHFESKNNQISLMQIDELIGCEGGIAPLIIAASGGAVFLIGLLWHVSSQNSDPQKAPQKKGFGSWAGK